MRILRVIATMNPKSGGPCQGIRNSIPVQKKAGISNEVVSLDIPGENFLKENEFKIHALGPVKGPYAYCKNLENWLKENLERFDIVIIHGLWLHNSYGTFRVWNTIKRRNKKIPELYVMPHGMLDPYFQKARSRKIKALRNWIFWNLIEKKVVNGADGLLFTCVEEMELAKRTFSNYKPKRTLNVGYGISSPPEKKEADYNNFLKKCPKLENRSYWLFLSRIHPKKGVDLLIKSYLKLKEQDSELPDLVIAGPGLESDYGQQMQKLGDNASIHFPGMLTGKTKWAAFHYSECFILPSHQENYGIAVVEAMACKKPVLITDQVNIWREIKNGKGGLISKDNLEGVCDVLKTWSNLSDRKKFELGRNAWNVFREKFSVENTALKMLDHFKVSKDLRNFNPRLKPEKFQEPVSNL
ncbi:glycosyltransferase [Gramella lutea]|uniref:Glycosyltransferase n=1 Tax=Christiangramia lutea TaxID=1607951 RepID=A0A9X1V1S1_9FLAO|nr:glycosyltransferase [Christiangramia lutea]MCH4822767.1 glycosyltransferase [Christiangramia lutea]